MPHRQSTEYTSQPKIEFVVVRVSHGQVRLHTLLLLLIPEMGVVSSLLELLRRE